MSVERDLYVAAHKLGCGCTGRLVDRYGQRSRAQLITAMLDEVQRGEGNAVFGQLAASPEILQSFFQFRMARKRARQQGMAPRTVKSVVPRIKRAELAARFRAGFDAPFGFRERLVQFWANHFTVSSINPRVGVLCGAFEREAIRPHVAGRFSDMLQAVTRHPAMLMYLDNAGSIGPNSRAGATAWQGAE